MLWEKRKLTKVFCPKSSQISNIVKIRHQIRIQLSILHLLRWVRIFYDHFTRGGQQMTMKHQQLVFYASLSPQECFKMIFHSGKLRI